MHPSRHRSAAVHLILALGLLLAAGPVALHAQDASSRGRPDVEGTGVPAPRPWQSLSPAQRDLLAPLHKDWDTLPPRRQAHMLEKSEHWLTLPPEQRERIRERIARWQAMSPEERRLARENMRKFHELPPDQRRELHQAFRQFQAMPPDRREQLLRKWHSLSTEQRRQWIDHMHRGHGRPAGPAPPGAGAPRHPF
ncbi:MAG TPA: DUF3106 domain-containing protein [Dyella sp.]|nr:DUF3106 domain-containing protein [Dyella sp.]